MCLTLLKRSLFGLVVAATLPASAVSPDQVQKQLSAGEKITFIDVRPTALFQAAHIPNAINVPAALVPQKQLPPLGHVVVYDGGLGPDTARAAASALSMKKGIKAEVLDGGFAAWEDARNTSTKPGGMRPEELPLISYAHLKQTAASEIVLVDLRQPHSDNPAKAASASAPHLTDLASEFPGVRIIHGPLTGFPAGKLATSGSGTQPLLVLIDNGDGAAEQTARALKASGMHRFAILAGGETILARKGQPGLQRLGTTVSTPRRPMAQPPAENPK